MMYKNEKYKKIEKLMAENQLDALILGNTYNIQYATGIHIPCAHAQPDLTMFALFASGQEPVVLVPKCWAGAAKQGSYFPNVITYHSNKPPLEAATDALITLCPSKVQIGIDDEAFSVEKRRKLSEAFEQNKLSPISCGALISKIRSLKTDEEIAQLTKIAYKTDHVINGHFHHLIADRPRTASLISESLRVHSLERDIEISGYAACSRAVLGKSISKFWAYAPKFGFADAEMTTENDAIIADVINAENGYWSNATRIAISSDEMSDEQEAAYSSLNKLRNMLLTSIHIGRKCSEIYDEIVKAARKQKLSLVESLCLGFCVGVSPKEGPFLSPGESQAIEASMVMVLDPVVQEGSNFYRSRDTVVITENGPELVNWYKDWREPYLAIPEL